MFYSRGETEVVWACQEEGRGVYGQEDAGYGRTRHMGERKTREKVHRRSERRVASGGCSPVGHRRPSGLEMNDLVFLFPFLLNSFFLIALCDT